MASLTSGFTGIQYAPTSDATLSALFFQDPDLLIDGDLQLAASALFQRVQISDLIDDAVIVLLQDIVTAGISPKATPAVFYQQRSSTPFIHILALVANLHGTNPLFPPQCSFFVHPAVVPLSVVVPHSYPGYVIALTSLGVDWFRNAVGDHFEAVWANTYLAVPPHPIRFVPVFPTVSVTGSQAPVIINSVGLVNAATSNPLFQVGSPVPNKSSAAQKTLFENIAFWYWWNGQDMNATLSLFGGIGAEDILSASSTDAILSKLNNRFLEYLICLSENIHLLMRGKCSKILSRNSNGSFSSISTCLFTKPNPDGSPYIFKKGSSVEDQLNTDPRLTSAIIDLFEIIVTLFTPNTDADQQHSAELLARISKFMNALLTTGNLAGAHIDVQVEFINDLLFNLFQIPKSLPFRGLK